MAPRIAVLPEDIIQILAQKLSSGSQSTSLRLLRLPHPRTNLGCLLLPNATGDVLHEIQNVDPPDQRSWFTGDDKVMSDGRLLIATPMDPVFLLFPVLLSQGSAENFRMIDDMFEEAADRLTETPGQSKPDDLASRADILALSDLPCIPKALKRVCEYKDISDELSVFRPSRPLLLEYLRTKATRLSSQENMQLCSVLTHALARDDLFNKDNAHLLEAGRLRVACETLSQYLPPILASELVASFDLTALDVYLADRVAKEAAANVAALADTANKKSTAKKGASEPKTGDKRKAGAGGSRGVEQLKKANTRGMSKLSSFFAKPTEDVAKAAEKVKA